MVFFHFEIMIIKGYICLSLKYSSFFCGVGGIPPSALQPFKAYCAKPRFSSSVHLQRRSMSDSERPLLAKGGIMGEKWPVKFSLTMRLRHCRVL
jgi:hypothetical protein